MAQLFIYNPVTHRSEVISDLEQFIGLCFHEDMNLEFPATDYRTSARNAVTDFCNRQPREQVQQVRDELEDLLDRTKTEAELETAAYGMGCAWKFSPWRAWFQAVFEYIDRVLGPPPPPKPAEPYLPPFPPARPAAPLPPPKPQSSAGWFVLALVFGVLASIAFLMQKSRSLQPSQVYIPPQKQQSGPVIKKSKKTKGIPVAIPGDQPAPQASPPPPPPVPEPIVATRFALPHDNPYNKALLEFKYEVDLNRNDGAWRSFGFLWNGDYELEFRSLYPKMADTNRKALYEIQWNGNAYKPASCWPAYDNNLPADSPERGQMICGAQLFGNSARGPNIIGLLPTSCNLGATPNCISALHSPIPQPVELRISPDTVLSIVHVRITTNCDQMYSCFYWPN